MVSVPPPPPPPSPPPPPPPPPQAVSMIKARKMAKERYFFMAHVLKLRYEYLLTLTNKVLKNLPIFN